MCDGSLRRQLTLSAWFHPGRQHYKRRHRPRWGHTGINPKGTAGRDIHTTE